MLFAFPANRRRTKAAVNAREAVLGHVGSKAAADHCIAKKLSAAEQDEASAAADWLATLCRFRFLRPPFRMFLRKTAASGPGSASGNYSAAVAGRAPEMDRLQ